jgi:MFS family permease
MPFIYFWGRAPVLFWVTLIAALLTLGACLVQDFTGFYALRALTGFFVSGSLTSGLAFIQDMFFLHEQARKIGIWFAIFNTCVYFAPMFAYYIMAATGSWRATFWMAFSLQAFVVLLIVLFIDETCYRRDLAPSEQPKRGNRLLRLTGIWQIQVHRRYFATITSSFLRLLQILYKPVIIPMYLF